MTGELVARQNGPGRDDAVAANGHYANGNGSAQRLDLQPLGVTVKEPTFGDMIAVLLKNKWLILSSVMVSFLAALLYCAIVPKFYTAVATLEIRGYAPLLETTAVESMYKLDTRKELYQRTTIARLGRISVADQALFNDPELLGEVSEYLSNRKVVDWSKLLDTLRLAISQQMPMPENIQSDGNTLKKLLTKDENFNIKASFLQSYLGLIDIVPVRDTSLVEVAVTTDNPKLSQRIANAHSEGFIDLLRKERAANLHTNLQFLRQQEEELKVKVSTAERALAAYAEKNKVLTVANSQEGDLMMKQISLLTDRLNNAVASRVQSENTLNSLVKQGDAASSSYLDTSSAKELLVTLKEAEAKYADLSVQFTPEYPAMQQLGARISSLRGDLARQRRQALEGLRMQVDTQKSLEAVLTSQIEEQKKFAHEVSQKLVEYNILSREADSLRDLYQNVLRQLKETQVGSTNSESNIYITDPAPVPNSPSKPLRGLILAMGLGLGLAIGLTLVFLKEVMNKCIETVEDVKSIAGLPSLGVMPSFSGINKHLQMHLLPSKSEDEEEEEDVKVSTPPAPEKHVGMLATVMLYPLLPVYKRLRRKKSRSASQKAGSRGFASSYSRRKRISQKRLHGNSFVTLSAPHAAVAEALRLIRTNLVLSYSADCAPRVIMVTSSNAGEGKTTLSSNLAVSLAQAGRKTMFLDCDMRQSKINQLFSFPDDSLGLVDYLAGQALPAEVLRTTNLPNLHVIPAGSCCPNPAELLGSQKMVDLMSLLSQEYDYVIVDSPPILPVADSLILSRCVSAVLIVARSKMTVKGALKETVNRLSNVGARIIGTVVNDVSNIDEQYGYGYGYSYTAATHSPVWAAQPAPVATNNDRNMVIHGKAVNSSSN